MTWQRSTEYAIVIMSTGYFSPLDLLPRAFSVRHNSMCSSFNVLSLYAPCFVTFRSPACFLLQWLHDCEMKLFWNNLKITSVFYFTCYHIRNWNKIISHANRNLKLFQKYYTDTEHVGKYSRAAISLCNNFETISREFARAEIKLFRTDVDECWNNLILHVTTTLITFLYLYFRLISKLSNFIFRVLYYLLLQISHSMFNCPRPCMAAVHWSSHMPFQIWHRMQECYRDCLVLLNSLQSLYG